MLKIETLQESETDEESNFEYTNYDSKYKNDLKGDYLFLAIFNQK